MKYVLCSPRNNLLIYEYIPNRINYGHVGYTQDSNAATRYSWEETQKVLQIQAFKNHSVIREDELCIYNILGT